MILEGLVTTLAVDGTLNVAPMGPIVEDGLHSLLLRPFQSSQTFRNLKAIPWGVFHVTDDVELIARAALHGLDVEPPSQPAAAIKGRVLSSACRWYEFRVESCDDHQPRAELKAVVVHQGYLREMSGFNRAMFAVLEATILATRLELIPQSQVADELSRLEPLVAKTAGEREQRAWSFVLDFIQTWNSRKLGEL